MSTMGQGRQISCNKIIRQNVRVGSRQKTIVRKLAGLKPLDSEQTNTFTGVCRNQNDLIS